MFSLFKPFRPDPFRFRRPRIKRWLYAWFRLQNFYLLRIKFKIVSLNISKKGKSLLKQIRSGSSHMILLNHVGFVDPHVMLELAFRGNFCVNFLAGIEPFDSARGVFGWHIQSVGGFSVDRGILDRNALKTAQSILDEGRYPLVIFPEGEAAYTNKILQSFYPGASLFALNTAESLKTDSKSVFITPIAIYYRFKDSPEAAIKDSIQKLFEEVSQKNSIPIFFDALNENISFWEQIQLLIHRSLNYLEQNYKNFPDHSTELPLHCRLEHLRDVIMAELVSEHCPENLKNRSTVQEDLMFTKNKLRSIIARKLHAPSLEELQSAIAQVQKSLSISVSSKNIKKLKSMELKWIGISNENEYMDKRLKILLKHLMQQKPYAEIRLKASNEDLNRWENQINDTRRVKMLTLLINDLKIKDESWEGIDEILVKLEILLFSRFVYRHPKEAFINVGQPIDVKQFLNTTIELTKKDHQENLTQHIKQTIETLFLDLPINFDNNIKASQKPVIF